MYTELIDQAIGQVYQKGVANKILQSMDRIRNESDPVQARRWPTELLQNARDLAYPNRPVRVQIELTDDAVCFRHSGKPFSVKDILSIINQVSSKKPGEGVGQFGTGFMSTFQLSMKVDVRSLLKDEGEPYRPFQICLDRSGATHEAISAAISQALESLKAADRASPVEGIDESAFNTEFRYHLDNDRSREIARIGADDLHNTLALTMLFSDRLGETELLAREGGADSSLIFRRGAHSTLPGGLERQEILVGEKTRIFYLLRQDGLTLAAEWNQERGFLPPDPNTPRLFIDFPLVGSERFPFPMVLNSLSLRPNEPRSGISLSENEQSLDGRENRALMDRAVALYQRFFPALYALDARGAEHIIEIPPPEENKEWSAFWVREHIYDRLYGFLSEQRIIPAGGEHRALCEQGLYLVWGKDHGTCKALAELCAQIRGVLVPEGETDWYTAFSGYTLPQDKVAVLETVLEQAQKIVLHGLEGETSAQWLARLYDLAMEDSAAAAGIGAGNTAIFPGQNGNDLNRGRLLTAKEIYSDPGIPEILKDASEQLDGLAEAGKLEIRSKLLCLEFQPAHSEGLPPAYPMSDFVSYIVTRSDRRFPVKNFAWYGASYEKMWDEAWKLLLASGPDGELYRLAQAGWQDLPEREDCSFLPQSEGMWRGAYRGVLSHLLRLIQSKAELEPLAEALCGRNGSMDPIRWLNLLYAKAARYLRVSDLYYDSIMLNQHGKFRAPSHLKLDEVGDEELKAITACFRGERESCGLYELLADRRLELKDWKIPSMQLEAAAGELNAALVQFFARSNLPQAPLELQEACTRLLSWLREHPEQAENYFPNFCREEDQMKLLTPSAAVSLRKKADRLSSLLSLAGTDDPEELERIVREGKTSKQAPNGQDGFDPDSGMWLDGGWDDLGDEERRERLRRIGEAGERCAFRAVVESLTGQGYTVKKLVENCAAELTAPDGTGLAVVEHPDTEHYKQAGWDIRVIVATEAESHSYYLEVKTHTPGSVARSLLPLSNEQARLAAEKGRNYIVLEVIYDEEEDRAAELYAYSNIPALIGRGVLYFPEGRCVLSRCERGMEQGDVTAPEAC